MIWQCRVCYNNNDGNDDNNDSKDDNVVALPDYECHVAIVVVRCVSCASVACLEHITTLCHDVAVLSVMYQRFHLSFKYDDNGNDDIGDNDDTGNDDDINKNDVQAVCVRYDAVVVVALLLVVYVGHRHCHAFKPWLSAPRRANQPQNKNNFTRHNKEKQKHK